MNMSAKNNPAQFEKTSSIQALRPVNPCKTSTIQPIIAKIAAILRGGVFGKTNTLTISITKKMRQ